MNYPIWDTGAIGGGPIIALVAVLHVYIAHLAVGGGLFLWWLDRKARRNGDVARESFLERYNVVFLLVTAVFGGVTGVGIWFTISVLNPAATSTLIHTFVFGWAIEWVFFVGEVVALAIYHYRFRTMRRDLRERVAFFYFLFAWLSLVAIDGILSFMLTPGRWLQEPSFWTGFLNPSFLPSMLFRTFIAVLNAGVFGVLVGAFQRDEALRQRLLRSCSWWVLVGAAGLVPTGWWYHAAVPAEVWEASFAVNPESALWGQVFLAGAVLTVALGLLVRLHLPTVIHRVAAVVIVLTGLGLMAGFEFVREHARRPYIIQGHTYANALSVRQKGAYAEEGLLAEARWVRPELREGGGSPEERGEALYRLQCSACHAIGGRNDIVAASSHLTYMGVLSALTGLGRTTGYMPPFYGSPEEKEALAAYLVGGLRGEEIVREPEPFEPRGKGFAMPEPVPEREDDGWVLLTWNDLGMHCISDSDPWFVILPPANTLEAQLIRRGDPPEVVTEGVTLTYAVEEGHAHPEQHVPFWDWVAENFGIPAEPGIGLKGHGLTGRFEADAETGSWAVHAIPVVPYADDGIYDPYPLFTVEAHDEASGALLARTAVVAPTSTEMGCRNCHGGDWKRPGIAGISDDTAKSILALHDARSGTSLLAEAEAGHPRLCQSCHADPAVGTAGDPMRLGFSAAMHGFHANVVHAEGAEACGMCHPALPNGRTRCLRGVHEQVGLDCVRCHGTLAQHALSLLGADTAPRATLLGSTLPPGSQAVNPRKPWHQEPDCLSCHVDFEKPAADASSFNQWVGAPAELFRMRTGEGGLRCTACHGSPHALYPSGNDFEPNIDNIQPLQYGSMPLPIGSEQSCTVCHTEEIEDAVHHPNMERPFRHKELWKK